MKGFNCPECGGNFICANVLIGYQKYVCPDCRNVYEMFCTGRLIKTGKKASERYIRWFRKFAKEK